MDISRLMVYVQRTLELDTQSQGSVAQGGNRVPVTYARCVSPIFIRLLHGNMAATRGAILILAEELTVFMQSLVAKSKRTL
ncbi:hypothetical protein H5410_047424 [Solanum commersonii]|uniref:Uncharacterized protein n=1 Tax=Solanum commersonii TaxID=4109 RepID=A0A9J5XIM7_SOLCO|nr:hypothetical protein H5410_047424 [Solanum commersonii]